jgi:hypothetical protein
MYVQQTHVKVVAVRKVADAANVCTPDDCSVPVLRGELEHVCTCRTNNGYKHLVSGHGSSATFPCLYGPLETIYKQKVKFDLRFVL